MKAGATIAISETLEASLQIGRKVLNTMCVFEEDVATLIESFRKEYYGWPGNGYSPVLGGGHDRRECAA